MLCFSLEFRPKTGYSIENYYNRIFQHAILTKSRIWGAAGAVNFFYMAVRINLYI